MHEKISQTAGAGFSDWQKVAEVAGDQRLGKLLRSMDSQPAADGRNAHHRIHDKLALLELPRQQCLFISIEKFLDDPQRQFSLMPHGDYYFVSIKPGVHLAHATSKEEVLSFVLNYAAISSPDELHRELYISHNGEAAMSGHIIIKDDGIPNSIFSEYTIDNFNAFHRGFHAPEISFERTFQAGHYSFRGALEADDWRDTTRFECVGGVYLSRPAMAQYIKQAVEAIPHDDGYYLPGYYEVLFEKTSTQSVRPVFIEAVVKGV